MADKDEELDHLGRLGAAIVLIGIFDVYQPDEEDLAFIKELLDPIINTKSS